MIFDDHYGGSDHNLVKRLVLNRKHYCDLHHCTVIHQSISILKKQLGDVHEGQGQGLGLGPSPGQGQGTRAKAEAVAVAIASSGGERDRDRQGDRGKEGDKLRTQLRSKEVIQRPAAWYKLLAMKYQLETNKFDYIMYLDMDMVIMNPSISLNTLLSLAPPQNSDFILTKDFNGINTGVMFAKNTEFTKWFLQTAWDQTQLIGPYSIDGIPHPFEYEQRAFHFMLDTEIWQKRKLPKYNGNTTELRSHFAVLPQCTMNSYLLHPLEFRANPEESQYISSDFIIHLAGKKGDIKTDLTSYYLTEAEKNYK
jgi:hypothetical protein